MKKMFIVLSLFTCAAHCTQQQETKRTAAKLSTLDDFKREFAAFVKDPIVHYDQIEELFRQAQETYNPAIQLWARSKAEEFKDVLQPLQAQQPTLSPAEQNRINQQLNEAVEAGNVVIARNLINQGAEVSFNSLYYPIKNFDYSMILLLKQHGANPAGRYYSYIDEFLQKLRNPALEGHVGQEKQLEEMTLFLIKQAGKVRADILVQEIPSAAIAKALIDAGASVNARSESDVTPLLANIKNPAVLKVLLEHGAEIEAVQQGSAGAERRGRHRRSYRKQSALIQAINLALPESVEVLLQYGADPLHRDIFGHDAYHFAQSSTPIIRTMLEDYRESAKVHDVRVAAKKGFLGKPTSIIADYLVGEPSHPVDRAALFTGVHCINAVEVLDMALYVPKKGSKLTAVDLAKKAGWRFGDDLKKFAPGELTLLVRSAGHCSVGIYVFQLPLENEGFFLVGFEKEKEWKSYNGDEIKNEVAKKTPGLVALNVDNVKWVVLYQEENRSVWGPNDALLKAKLLLPITQLLGTIVYAPTTNNRLATSAAKRAGFSFDETNRFKRGELVIVPKGKNYVWGVVLEQHESSAQYSVQVARPTYEAFYKKAFVEVPVHDIGKYTKKEILASYTLPSAEVVPEGERKKSSEEETGD